MTPAALQHVILWNHWNDSGIWIVRLDRFESDRAGEHGSQSDSWMDRDAPAGEDEEDEGRRRNRRSCCRISPIIEENRNELRRIFPACFPAGPIVVKHLSQ